MWGFFDIKGIKLSDLQYTGIGCKAEEHKDNQKNEEINKKTTGNLLTIDEYELIGIK